MARAIQAAGQAARSVAGSGSCWRRRRCRLVCHAIVGHRCGWRCGSTVHECDVREPRRQQQRQHSRAWCLFITDMLVQLI